MPWSNQGGGPWGSGSKGPWGSSPQSSGPTPPDLEEILRRGQDKLRGVLPGGSLGSKGFALLVLGMVVGPFQDRAAPLFECEAEVTCVPGSELLVVRLRLQEYAPDSGDSRHGSHHARSRRSREGAIARASPSGHDRL